MGSEDLALVVCGAVLLAKEVMCKAFGMGLQYNWKHDGLVVRLVCRYCECNLNFRNLNSLASANLQGIDHIKLALYESKKM